MLRGGKLGFRWAGFGWRGSTILTEGFGQPFMRIWDATTGRELDPGFAREKEFDLGAAVSPDGRLLSFNGAVWDLRTEKIVQRLAVEERLPIEEQFYRAFSWDSRVLFVANGKGIELVTGKVRFRYNRESTLSLIQRL